MDFWLLLARMQARPGAFVPAIEALGSARAVFEASTVELCDVLGLRLSDLRKLVRVENEADLAVERSAFVASGAEIVTVLQDRYPPRLRELPDRPACLFVRGNPDVLAQDAVAIVGSRTASEVSVLDARELARSLAAQGVAVVSGLAVGVDGAAHEGALEAGTTIAVLGCGIDVVYPRTHRELRDRIVERGLLLTELPMRATPRAFTFPARNRIIAGLSQATVVVGARERSGALLTAAACQSLGRPVAVLPGDARDDRHRGGLRLIGQGATLVESADEALRLIGRASSSEPRAGRPRAPSLSPDESLVHGMLDVEPVHTDDLAQRCGLDAPRLAAALLLLEVKGLAQRHSGGRYTRSSA